MAADNSQSSFFNDSNVQQIFDWANQWSQHALEQCKILPTSSNQVTQAVWQDYIESFKAFSNNEINQPQKLLEKQSKLWCQHIELSQSIYQKMLGETPPAIAEPEPSDRRFDDSEWQDNFLFDYIKQAYLINSRFCIDLVEKVDGLEEQDKQKLLFYVRQWINAMSPSNFIATNPEILRKTFQTNGKNLIDGMKQLNHDFKQSIDTLNISITDPTAFKLGKNLAATPGKVIFENSLFQLIHYQPKNSRVFNRPLLIVPPWINKYYVLDLRENNSFVNWTLEQGHDTYMISWINPDESYAETTFEDYINLAVIEALDQVEAASKVSQINCIGYCLGGTLLASTVAYLNQINDHRIVSATYLATLLDFSHQGEIGVFINDTALRSIEDTMDKQGYFDGRAMAVAFNLLRENELYWNYFVNNYLKGEKPSAFDLLFWSSDSTNIPAALHKFVLRELYQKNNLVKSNQLKINGTPIDLSNVDIPAYFISPKLDHIAKWESTYLSARAHGKSARFVLGESGHIAGIINPPSKGKYGYWVGTSKELPENHNEWLTNAEKQQASWWLDWQQWISAQDSELTQARTPGENGVEIIEDAPGRYVMKRISTF